MRFRLNFAFTLKILHYVRLTIHWQSFYITHGMEYSSVCLTERTTLNLHPDFSAIKSYKRSLEENVETCGVCKSMKRCLLIAYCLRIYILWVPFLEVRKHGVTVPGKLCNFCLLMTNILIYASYKFETYIFKIVIVISGKYMYCVSLCTEYRMTFTLQLCFTNV